MKDVFTYPDGHVVYVAPEIQGEQFHEVESRLFDAHGGYPVDAHEYRDSDAAIIGEYVA